MTSLTDFLGLISSEDSDVTPHLITVIFLIGSLYKYGVNKTNTIHRGKDKVESFLSEETDLKELLQKMIEPYLCSYGKNSKQNLFLVDFEDKTSFFKEKLLLIFRDEKLISTCCSVRAHNSVKPEGEVLVGGVEDGVFTRTGGVFLTKDIRPKEAYQNWLDSKHDSSESKKDFLNLTSEEEVIALATYFLVEKVFNKKGSIDLAKEVIENLKSIFSERTSFSKRRRPYRKNQRNSRITL